MVILRLKVQRILSKPSTDYRLLVDLDKMSLDDVYNHLKVYEPEIKYKDITQIDEDDIEEMDIKWNMALVSHFARECKAPRSQDKGKRESYKQGSKEEEPAPKVLMAIDVIGWDWSYMANEEENHALVADDKVLTEFALMAKSSTSSENEVYDDSYYSKSCRKKTENLNTKISKLNEELSNCETELYHYKRGLSQVEARLVKFKGQEIKFYEKIRGLERDLEVRNNKIKYLMNELEQVKKEKEGGSWIQCSSLPPTQVYSPPKKDLSWTGLPKFVDDTITDYSRPIPSIDASSSNTSDLQSSNVFVSELGESSDSIMSKPMIKFVKTAKCPRVIKTNNTENARKSTVKYAEMYKNTSKSPKVRGYWDSGCSWHMTGNISYLSEYEPYDGGYVSFRQGGGKITVVVARTSSTNISGTKNVASHDVKKDVSSLRYIALPNWFHEAHMDTRNYDAPDGCNTDVPENSGISNSTASSKVPTADQVEPAVSITIKSEIPTEEGINYEEVFAPVARIEAIRLFLAYASFMSFIVYRMDVKSAFLYVTIDEEVYVMQPLGFQDPEFPDRVYKVEKRKDGPGKDVELHLYRSMIGSLMYLTASRPDIMFAVCAYARHQVTPKECLLHAVKRILRYLKGHPKLGLWYLKEYPFDLVSYSDSDYDGATQDRKSTTGGCLFLGRRLISEIMHDPEREVGYGITDAWDEIVETLQGAPVSTDTELGGYVREFETGVRQDMDEIYMRLDDEHTERQLLAGRLNMLFKDRHAHAYTRHLMETEARMSREAWVRATDVSDLVHGEVMSLRTTMLGQMSEIRELQAADRRRQTVILELLRIDHRRSKEISELRTALQGQKQMAPRRTTRSTADQETINATPATNAQLQAMIDQGVTVALAARDALRSTNGDDSHNSGTGVRRTEQANRECTYTNFLKCQPLPFKGTEGVASLSQLCERMDRLRYDLENAHEDDDWKILSSKRDQETRNGTLGSEESDKIEKYVGGLLDMIHGSVVASKPKTMQEAIEIATELMDKKIRTFAERETVNKRKFENTSRNTQNQQQQHSNKRQNTDRVYTVTSGEKKQYGGSKPLCAKCNYHHDGLCAPKCRNCKQIGHLA
nr:uncharacterized mitochondrial protein AtMg00810-like [Tanacetum cinerariifolium]